MTLINHTLLDQDALASACMPFVVRGGLFLKGHFYYPLGTLVEVCLHIGTSIDPVVFAAKVIWLTPLYERDQWPEGMGVQFSEEDAKRVRAYIESLVENAFTPNGNGFF